MSPGFDLGVKVSVLLNSTDQSVRLPQRPRRAPLDPAPVLGKRCLWKSPEVGWRCWPAGNSDRDEAAGRDATKKFVLRWLYRVGERT
jgi:hypothetical protein